MKVTILSGVPGSGKSTIANSLSGVVICSADDYFVVNGNYQFDPSQLPKAHSSCLRSFINALGDGCPSVVCDNTNTTAVEIAPYYAVAVAYGYQVEIVTVMVADDKLGLCAERNKHQVPLKSIQRMTENIKRRKLQPYWNARTVEATF